MSDKLQLGYAEFVHLTWTGKLEFSQLVEYANQLTANGFNGLAAVLYRTWIQRNASRFNHYANFNLAVALFSENDTEGARQAYEEAIRLAPDFLQPRFNLGLTYERAGRLDLAIEQWRWIAAHASPEKADERGLLVSTLNNLGRVHESLKQYADALDYLDRSLLLDPEQPDTLHHWVFLRQKQCLWPVYAPLGEVRPELMHASTSALAMIALTDDPEAQLAAATNHTRRKIPANLPALAEAGRAYGHDKIRIAYCSSDFCLHPVSMLTAELLEHHDKTQFEVYAFCWSPEDGSQLRQRVINAVDHFIRIDKLSDEEAARLIRAHEIDILIDLHGQTRGARTTMLAYRPAPIQITYLGLPATTGLPCIDYVIADRFLIPEEYAPFYSEKPIYMPDIYQVSDRRRLCAPPPTRKSCGLPEEGFVFCSFNNNYKFNAEVFGTWMNILQRVPGSVLWLLSDNRWAEDNLRKEAARRGVDGERLIFAGRVAPENYLARYSAADLFLDTFPFNAGTTANDALWMGLPILTMSGRSFAARMAGALLTAADLPELITYNLRDYEEKAVALAQDPKKCRDLHQHLVEVREGGRLFDTPRFARNLEKEFKALAAGGRQ